MWVRFPPEPLRNRPISKIRRFLHFTPSFRLQLEPIGAGSKQKCFNNVSVFSDGDENLLEKYKFGWSLPFSLFYDNLTLGDVPVFASLKESLEWADSAIQHAGSIQICNQFLDYKKAELMTLSNSKDLFRIAFLPSGSSTA
jgi:hypothetical protein